MRKKLFIPGPVEVYPDALKVMATPMIGHRTKEYTELHRNVKLKLQQLLYTKKRIFLSTSSGTGLMEACMRNCVSKRVVNFICGEFGERWYEIAQANGKQADAVRVDLGKAIKPEQVKKALKTGKYDGELALNIYPFLSGNNHLSPSPEVFLDYCGFDLGLFERFIEERISAHTAFSANFSASLAQISPDNNLGNRASRISTRAQDSEIFKIIWSINGLTFVVNTSTMSSGGNTTL